MVLLVVDTQKGIVGMDACMRLKRLSATSGN